MPARRTANSDRERTRHQLVNWRRSSGQASRVRPRYQATSAVFTFVLGNALGLAATASFTRKLGRDGGDVQALMQASRAEVVELAAQFPRLRARLELPSAGYGAAPQGSFAFGLQAVLDGLEARLATRATSDASG